MIGGASDAIDPMLVEYLRVLEQTSCDRRAVHIALTALSLLNRRPQYLRLAREGFERLADEGRGELFGAPKGDLLFFFPGDQQAFVDAELRRLASLFADDPACRRAAVGFPLISVFDADTEFTEIIEIVRRGAMGRVSPEDCGPPEPTSVAPAKRISIGPEHLALLEAGCARVDVSSFIRRRPICALDDAGAPEIVMTEHTIAIDQLVQSLMPGIDVNAEPWLARQVALAIDRRELTLMERPRADEPGGPILVRLRMETLLSEAFLAFDERLPVARRGTIVILLDPTDVFSDIVSARVAIAAARARGCRFAIKVAGDASMMIPWRNLGFEWIKIDGTSALSRTPRDADQSARSNVILAGVDTREVLRRGRAEGVRLFEGRYVEHLLRDDHARRRLVRGA